MSLVADAHLNDPNVPPCFDWKNDRVVPRADTSASNTIVFSQPVLTPINASRFDAGQRLKVTSRMTGQLCSPHSVFLEARQGTASALVQTTTPSPIYPPGAVDHEIVHYLTFAIDPKNARPNAEARVTALRLVVSQYGSHRELGAIEIPFDAVWRAAQRMNVAGIPEYECIDDMKLPAMIAQLESPRCSNSVPQPKGGAALDLNRDGVCEWTVRDLACDKTHGNLCFRILQERDGDLVPFAQFYNKLTLHESDTGHLGLSSTETGPLTSVTRYSEWQSSEYVTHMYVHDCSRVP